jgi:uncharacterized membrane protein YgdD (TMEM256/DUF423 family)
MTFILRWAGFLGSVAIIILAMSSHVLPKHFEIDQIASINTAANIQLFHSIALLIIGFQNNYSKQLRIIGIFMLAGVCCFSFSIYFLILNKLWNIAMIHNLWPITPLGGILLIISWVLIIVYAKNLTLNNKSIS